MEFSWWQAFLAGAGLVVSICSLLGGLILWQSSRLAKQLNDAEARMRAEYQASEARMRAEQQAFAARIRAEQQAAEARMRSERQASETRIMERFRSLEESNRAEHGELRSAVSGLTEKVGELRGTAKSGSATDERP